MTWKSRIRTGAIGVGICLMAATLAGANRLLDADSQPTTSASPPSRPTSAATPSLPSGGVIVLGVVGPDPIPIGPPSIAALATVTKVHVKEGEAVDAGAPLVQFDDRILQKKLAQARAELMAAEQDVLKAEAALQIHAGQVELQQSAIKAVEDDLKAAEYAFKAVSDALERVLAAERNLNTNQPLSEAEKQRRRDENAELQKARHLVTQLHHKLTAETKKLQLLRLSPVAADRMQAQAKVERLKATVAEAETAVELCLVRAPVSGVVEQLIASPGMTYGPSTRSPLAWLIPSGPIIVRAEVEAEFAHRVSGTIGRKVTVSDHNNVAITYEGTVTRIGNAFLPKRTASDVLAVNASPRVLECLIEIADPAPSGRPPLRIGQSVRVSFP